MSYSKIKRHFKKVDPVIYRVMADLDFNQWLAPRRRKRGDYFMSLCREIIGQQLSGKVADVILHRFKSAFTKKTPTPRKVLKVSDQKLRDIGMSWAKVSYVKDLAQKTLKKEVGLHVLDRLDDQEVMVELTKIKGIGPWTAEMFLIFTLRRENVFSHGDLGLRKGIQKLYRLENPTQEKIEKIIGPWSPYKSYGSIALWHSLEG